MGGYRLQFETGDRTEVPMSVELILIIVVILVLFGGGGGYWGRGRGYW
jgi:hypothetical protein